MKTKKPKIEPVRFKLAGSEFSLTENLLIEGEFHPIPLTLWAAIIGFHRQISINMDAESVSYHKWSVKEGRYHNMIPWQKTSKHGLKVDVNWQDPKNQDLLNQYGIKYGEDFFPACTIHTHVDAGAFESGTDAKDEEDNPGWHITLGNLIRKDEYDFDFRMRLPQTKKLKEHVNTGVKINLKEGHLFKEATKNKTFISTTPGTTDWHKFIERVEAK